MADIKEKDKKLENAAGLQRLEEIEADSEDSELFAEATALSLRQKLLLWASGFGCLLLSVLYLFPIEEVLRSYISKNSETAGFVLDFKRLNLSLLGESSIDSLIYLPKDNSLELRVEELAAELSLLQLFQSILNGKLRATSFSVELPQYMFTAKSIMISELNMSGIDKEWVHYHGSISLQLSGGKILKTPLIPFLGDLKDVTVSSLTLVLKKGGNRINFEQALIKSSIATLKIKGKIDLSPTLTASRLEIEVCPKLTDQYAKERQDIASTLQLVSKPGQETCIPIQGTIGDPKPIVPSLGGGGEGQPPVNPQ
jgi:hypothetical protein